MRGVPAFSLLAGWMVVAFGGCMATLRHGGSTSEAANGGEIHLARFLAAERGQQFYRRSAMDRADEEHSYYTRRFLAGGRIEGSLLGAVGLPLSDYIHRSPGSSARTINWPVDPAHRQHGFVIEFTPPLIEWPLHLPAGEMTCPPVELQAYGRDGRFFTSGKAQRRVRFVTEEAVLIDGVTHRDCAHLLGETELRFGWWAKVMLEERVWISPEVGTVRRIERIRGVALLLWPFRSSFLYELMESRPGATESRDFAQADLAVSRLAMHLDRSYPRPRMGGAAVEWAISSNPAAVGDRTSDAGLRRSGGWKSGAPIAGGDRR